MTVVPALSFQDVAQAATDFLKKYHPSFEIPIPIEQIIDVQMGIDIIPFPRLYKDHRLNGFLTHDRSSIWVDEIQGEQFYEKYRYTLAHEIAHYVLHGEIYEEASFKTLQDYIKWRLVMPRKEIGWFEAHGNQFAGHVLVPSGPLLKACHDLSSEYKDNDLPFDIYSSDFWSYAVNDIAPLFEVNPPVVEIQIRRANIIEKLRHIEKS
jgi:hypothetical protein